MSRSPRVHRVGALVFVLLALPLQAEVDPDRYASVARRFGGLESPPPDKAVALRFSSLVPVRWPELELLRVAIGGEGEQAWFDGHARPRRPGEDIMGAQVVSISAGKVVLQKEGERRTLRTTGDFPDIQVREIRKIEAVPVVFFDEEKRARYVGDTYQNVRIVTIREGAIRVEYQGLERDLFPPEVDEVTPDFPEMRITGTLKMPAGMMAFIDGEPQAHGVGEVIHGARILEITSRHVILEHNGEKRELPVAHDFTGSPRKKPPAEREDRRRFRVVRPRDRGGRAGRNNPQQQVEKLLPQIFQDVRKMLNR